MIVDDEPLAVSLLENFVSRIDFLELKGSFTDSLEALSEMRRNPVDLVFLDIQMPDLDGMNLAHLLPGHTKIIFTTAFKEYAFESYDVSAIDFLLKPIRFDKILRACEKALHWFEITSNPSSSSAAETTCNEIYLKTDGALQKIEIERIMLVEGMKDYVKFYIEGSKSMVTHMTMKNAESLLPASRFMRVSRSHIVSLPHIRTIDRNFCLYVGNNMIRITELYRPAFEKYLESRTAK